MLSLWIVNTITNNFFPELFVRADTYTRKNLSASLKMLFEYNLFFTEATLHIFVTCFAYEICVLQDSAFNFVAKFFVATQFALILTILTLEFIWLPLMIFVFLRTSHSYQKNQLHIIKL